MGRWTVNVADVNGVDVVGGGGRDVGGDSPEVTRGITPVDGAAAPDGGVPMGLHTYLDWESPPKCGQAISRDISSLPTATPNLPKNPSLG